MNWDAIGAIGELIGALAVVITLVFLVLQVRHNTRAMNESNRLERASAIDKHADSISRWRGRLMENEDLARIWLAATKNQELNDQELIRLENLWIDFVNTQRSNYGRSNVVGEVGVARQSLLSVAVQCAQSATFKEHWKLMRPWMELASMDFVDGVESELLKLETGETDQFSANTLLIDLTKN